jgi:hypothetical protein
VADDLGGVGARGDLAACGRQVHARGPLGDPGAVEAVQGLGGLPVAGGGGDDGLEQRALAVVGERGEDEAGERLEVAVERAGVGAWQRGLGHLGEHVGDERGDGAPAAVDGGLADAGAAGDLGQVDAAGPPLHQGVAGGAEHGLADPGGATAGADRARSGCVLIHNGTPVALTIRSALA